MNDTDIPRWLIYAGDITRPIYVGRRENGNEAVEFAKECMIQSHRQHFVCYLLSETFPDLPHTHPVPDATPTF